MHKLRNQNHKEILERVMNIIPPGYKDPIFKNMKRKTRQFCSSKHWNEDEIRKEIESDNWYYNPIFFRE